MLDVVELPPHIEYWLTQRSRFLFIRKCDKDLLQIARKTKSTNDGIVITGNPGIGKLLLLLEFN